MAIPSASSRSAASLQMCTSEPVPIRITSGSPSLNASRSAYAPRWIASSGTALGFHTGSPWRLSAMATGVLVCSSAKRQASAVSFAPAGRTM